MTMNAKELSHRVENLNIYKRGARRAPHKPLLFMVALAALQRGEHTLTYAEVEQRLKPLLIQFAPPVKGSVEASLPFWHLQSDGVWLVENADQMKRNKKGFPLRAELKQSSGHFEPSVARLLQASPTLQQQVTERLLEGHFPSSMHDEIITATGLVVGSQDDEKISYTVFSRRKRDPDFRRKVMRAYEHRCVVTGFRAALDGQYFGTEAAHVKWHTHNGPDAVSNGLVLEPTMHLMFDRGAWTLSDDRRVIVSTAFTGSDSAVARLRAMNGKPIREPLPGYDEVALDYIRWHREADQGGIFRG